MLEVSPLGLAAVALVGLALIVGVFRFVFVQLRRFGLRVRGDVIDRKGIAKKVGEIDEMLKLDTPMARRLAVIEADKVFDYTLKEMMFTGRTMGDRLKLAGAKYKPVRRVWEPHKLRNRLVHEHAAKVSRAQAAKAISTYKSVLREIGIL